MNKHLHQSPKNNYLYKHNCKHCYNSIRIKLGNKSFYKCKKNIGVFPVSTKFIECKLFNK